MTPPNEPREPVGRQPILPVEYTASAFDEPVIVRPCERPGWAELVQRRDGITRALVRLPKP